MNKFITTTLIAVAAVSILGCMNQAPMQKNSQLDNNAYKAANSCPPPGSSTSKLLTRKIMQVSKQYTVDELEPKAAKYLRQRCGMSGEKVRGVKLKIAELRKMGALYSNIDSNSEDVILIEYKGSFKSEHSVHKKGDNTPANETKYPYASLVIDANTGELLTRSLYDDRFLVK